MVDMSHPSPVELRPLSPAVELESALLADGVRAIEDPVLPGAEAAEDPRLGRLPAPEAQAGFHARQRVRRQRGALLERDAHLVGPVYVVGSGRDQPEGEGLTPVEQLA